MVDIDRKEITRHTTLDTVLFSGRKGPSVLVMAGVHGDETDGVLIAARLIRRLSNAEICGTVRIISVANPPAFHRGLRCIPDSGDLNRAFTGRGGNSPAHDIAATIETEFMAEAGLVMDLHTGGRAVTYHPTSMIPETAWQSSAQAYATLIAQFGFPAFLYDKADDHPSSVFGACARSGCRVLSAELGGGSAVNPDTIRRATDGILTVLSGLGILSDRSGRLDRLNRGNPADAPPLVFRRRRADQSPRAEFDGLFEPAVVPGTWVKKGDPMGYLHDPSAIWDRPAVIRADCDGIVLCLRAAARTPAGEILAKIGVPLKGSHR